MWTRDPERRQRVNTIPEKYESEKENGQKTFEKQAVIIYLYVNLETNKWISTAPLWPHNVLQKVIKGHQTPEKCTFVNS